MSEWISKEEFLEALENEGADLFECDGYEESESGFSRECIHKVMEQLSSTVQPEVRHGTWIEKEDWNVDDYYYTCSVCGEDFVTVEGTPAENGWHFCPNCGADMRELPEPPKEAVNGQINEIQQ